LIVCEGEKTEPNYFRALIAYHRLNTVFVDTDEGRQLEVTVNGTGFNTLSLVNYAEQKQRRDVDGYHEIWCVFDKGQFSRRRFRQRRRKNTGPRFPERRLVK
jgi:hypothetical protein